MDKSTAAYIFRYYSRWLTENERLAHRHLFGTMKSMHGRSDVNAQSEARDRRPPLRELFSDDPDVLKLTNEGYDAFVMRTSERIFREHKDEIVLNCCPKCGALAITPKARQCRYCRHDWHNAG